MKRIFGTRILGLFIFAIVLAACGGTDADEPTDNQTTPTSATATPTAAPTIDTGGATGGNTMGTAYIETLEVFILESFPVQVQALVSGSLSDGCTTIADVGAQQNGETFQIQIETTRDPEALCTQALVPFERTVDLKVAGLPAGTYTVMAGDLSETFTLTVDNALSPTPNLSSASLTVDVSSAAPGQTVSLSGSGYPAGATVAIGIGPPASEYEIIDNAQVGENGRFTAQVEVPTYVKPGEQWVFVADVENAKVIADPITISSAITSATTPVTTPAGTSTSVPDDGVNQPVNGQFSRTYIFLIALEAAGQSGEMIGCGDSVIPVAVEIRPTAAPLTAALNELLSLNEQYYGESGLYNALYQSNLRVETVAVQNGHALIQLVGDLQLGGTCDNPRVQAQLEETALQYHTVNSVTITVNDIPLGVLLSGQ